MHPCTCNFCGSLDIKAVKIAKFSKISRQSINKIIKNIRVLIAIECEKISKIQGEIEIVESYFATKRVCGKRRRVNNIKTSMFLLLAMCLRTL